MTTPQDIQSKIGETIGTSDWLEVSQERINQFAEATEDFQFIHVNEEAAKMTPFGGTIAHGFLTLSLLSRLYELANPPRPDGVKMAVNYGMNKVRFINPVPSGSRVRATAQTVGVELKGNAIDQTRLMTVEIEGQEKPALIAEWIGRTVFDS